MPSSPLTLPYLPLLFRPRCLPAHRPFSFSFKLVMLPANLLFTSLLLASSVAALSPLLDSWHARPHVPYVDEPDDSVSVFHVSTNEQISSYKETYYFDQLIDHNNHKLGTFKQRYWHSYEFYEPGACPMIFTSIMSLITLPRGYDRPHDSGRSQRGW